MASPAFPGAEEWVPVDHSITALREAAQDCHGCDLYRDATQAVMGDGPRDARIVLVGEQPGDKEDLAGEPFVGPAGRLLDGALEEAGIAPEIVFRTNAVKHFRFTRRGKRRIHEGPSRWHVAACQPWLLAELDRLRPPVVGLLGATAGQSVFGSAFRVTKMRGQVLDWPLERIPMAHSPSAVVATVHPSAVLRSRSRESDLAAFVEDLQAMHSALAAG